MSKFIKTIKEYKKAGLVLNEDKFFDILDSMQEVLIDYENTHPDHFWYMMKELHEDFKGEHFDNFYAEHTVSKMFHTTTDGRMCKGEKFDMVKAQEVHSKYRTILKPSDNVCDVYVALNSQYHDYVCLYRTWFNTTDETILELRVIESTIKFWFQNEDRKEGDNVWKHFKHIK